MKLVFAVISLTIALIVKFVIFSPSNERVDNIAFTAPSAPSGAALSDGNLSAADRAVLDDLLAKMGFAAEKEETKRKLPQIEQKKGWKGMTDGDLIKNLMNPNANKQQKTSRLPQIQQKQKTFLDTMN